MSITTSKLRQLCCKAKIFTVGNTIIELTRRDPYDKHTEYVQRPSKIMIGQRNLDSSESESDKILIYLKNCGLKLKHRIVYREHGVEEMMVMQGVRGWHLDVGEGTKIRRISHREAVEGGSAPSEPER